MLYVPYEIRPLEHYWRLISFTLYTVKKEKKIFLIYREIQKGSSAKSYITKGSLIYEEMPKDLVINEGTVSHI
jgi:hypothetical protein